MNIDAKMSIMTTNTLLALWVWLSVSIFIHSGTGVHPEGSFDSPSWRKNLAGPYLYVYHLYPNLKITPGEWLPYLWANLWVQKTAMMWWLNGPSYDSTT